MKKMIIFTLLSLSLIMLGTVLYFEGAVAGEYTIYPTLPGTSVRDYSQPGYIVDEDSGTMYRTLPGTSVRDYSTPGLVQDGDTLYPTVPGTSIRDYSRPGYTIERY